MNDAAIVNALRNEIACFRERGVVLGNVGLQEAAAERLEELAKQLEQAETHNREVSSLPNCNDCMDVKACAYRPQWGDWVRFNCPLWRGPAAENGGASND
mgnify:CR=1 FL=1